MYLAGYMCYIPSMKVKNYEKNLRCSQGGTTGKLKKDLNYRRTEEDLIQLLILLLFFLFCLFSYKLAKH